MSRTRLRREGETKVREISGVGRGVWSWGLAAILAAGCGGGEQPPAAAPAQPAAAAAGVKVDDFPLQGVVRRVEPERDHVTIRHDAIPGFMDAMTMRFLVKDQPVIEELQVGDLVKGTLRVARRDGVVESYELLNLEVTKRAEPKSMVLEFSKGQVQARPAVKRLAVGDPVPDFTMTTQEGQALKLSDLRGYVVVITFIYTRCPLPDFCPLMDKKFADLSGRLAPVSSRADRVRLVSLSFDPEHDTPEVLKKHAAARGARPPLWQYAGASHPELKKIAAPLGLVYGANGEEIAHNLCTAVVDPDGRLGWLAVGSAENRWESADMLKTIVKLLPRRGQ